MLVVVDTAGSLTLAPQSSLELYTSNKCDN